jgi:hypothetical protein
LTEAGLMPNPNGERETGEKRKKAKGLQIQNKRRKLNNSAEEVWKEEQSDEVKTFLKTAPAVPVSMGKSKQLEIVPLAGIE